ncbi:MAG: hypothetical protein ABIP65_07680 [Vicinamibacterales bacterium]
MHYFYRMALVTMVLATSMSVAATGRVTVALLVSGVLCWSFIPALQLASGLLFLRGSRVDRGRALDGYFATHRFWSLWLLAMASFVLLLPQPGRSTLPLALTGVVPAALTIRGLMRFSRDALGDSSATAWRRVARHQAATFIVLVIYVELSVALWPRILGVFGR